MVNKQSLNIKQPHHNTTQPWCSLCAVFVISDMQELHILSFTCDFHFSLQWFFFQEDVLRSAAPHGADKKAFFSEMSKLVLM